MKRYSNLISNLHFSLTGSTHGLRIIFNRKGLKRSKNKRKIRGVVLWKEQKIL